MCGQKTAFDRFMVSLSFLTHKMCTHATLISNWLTPYNTSRIVSINTRATPRSKIACDLSPHDATQESKQVHHLEFRICSEIIDGTDMKQQAQVIGKYIMVVVVRVRTKKLSPVYFTIGHYEIYAGKKNRQITIKTYRTFWERGSPGAGLIIIISGGWG